MSRLAELRPLVEEYEQLQQVADRLGFDLDKGRTRRPAARATQRRATATKRPAASKPARSTRRRSTSRRAAGGTKAVGAERRARMLQLIEDRPGITVPDISRELGVDAPPLYRTVRKLQAEGLIKKEGKSLTLA